MEQQTAETPKREKKWTKDYMREYQRKYMRERWRRVYGVKPENYTGERGRQTPLEEQAKAFGEGAIAFVKAQREKKKKAKPPVEKVVCPICQVEHNNTEGMKRKHDRTIRHKLALEIYDAHKQAWEAGKTASVGST